MKKIYSCGKIIHTELYNQVQELDKRIFYGCNDEFKANRDWWVILNDAGKIIAYCGCLYSDGVCIFVRAWVRAKHRGKGYQKRMIKTRLRNAINKGCYAAITYTTYNNCISANNLFKMGFKLYTPSYLYAGQMMYFRKQL